MVRSIFDTNGIPYFSLKITVLTFLKENGKMKLSRETVF